MSDYEEHIEKMLRDCQAMLSQLEEQLNKRVVKLCEKDPEWRHLRGRSEVLQGTINYINKIKKAEDHATGTKSDNGTKTRPFPSNRPSTETGPETEPTGA
jgi:hypothetical protein